MKRGIKSTFVSEKEKNVLEPKASFFVFSIKSLRKGFDFSEVENWIFSV